MADGHPVTAARTASDSVGRHRTSLCARTMTGLQGLISQMESKVERKLMKACKTAKVCEDAAEKTMTAMTRIYGYNRRVIVHTHMAELKFVEDAERLARNLTSLRQRSSRLSLQLKELKDSVQKQMEDLYRTEVDVDMKLRACYGSCRSALPFSVDHVGHRTLQTDVEQMDWVLHQRRKSATPLKHIPCLKLQPADVGPPPPAHYKSIPAVRRELLTQFEDIRQNQVVLEDLDPAEV